jgi:hypothetical protein
LLLVVPGRLLLLAVPGRLLLLVVPGRLLLLLVPGLPVVPVVPGRPIVDVFGRFVFPVVVRPGAVAECPDGAECWLGAEWL